MVFIASRKLYNLSREELDEWYNIYVESCVAISGKESADSDVADFETPLFHQEEEHYFAVYDNTDSVNSNGEVVEGSRYNLNGNASEMHAGLVETKEVVSLNMSMGGFDSRLKYVVSN